MAERKLATCGKEGKETAAERGLAGGRSRATQAEALDGKHGRPLRAWGGKYRRGETFDEGRAKKAGAQSSTAKEQKIKIKTLDFTVGGLYLLFVK